MNLKFCLCIIVFLKVSDVFSIKAFLQAVPSIVRRGGHTILRCTYRDLRGAPLYVVKWYRGTGEFYRYDPNDIPQKRVFTIPGIYVDLEYSNSSQVTIRKMDFISSGNYKCEVSADGPPFPTAESIAHVEVVAPPVGAPVLRTNSTRCSPGDELLVNCTSPPSRPPVNLTIYINNQQMTGAKTTYYEAQNGFKGTEVVANEILTDSHFTGGRVVIKCVAQLRPVYSEATNKTLWLSRDPIPERITSPGGAANLMTSSAKILLLLAVLCSLLINEVLLQDYGDTYSFSDEISFQDVDYDSIPPEVQASILS